MTRASHNLRKYSPILISSAVRSSSECTTASGELTLAIATSDHQVSFIRSSQGKSNSVASIMLVRSTETRSAQSKISFLGNASSTSDVRSRIRRLEIGEVGRRHDRRDRAPLRGMARRVHADEIGTLLPLRLVGDLDTAEFGGRRIGLVVELDRKNVVVARHRPIGTERRGLAIMHGIVAAQLRKQRPPGVVLVQPGIADIDRFEACFAAPGPSFRSPRRRFTGDLRR